MFATAQGSLGSLLLDTLLFKKEMPYDSDNTQQFGYLFIKKKINTGDIILIGLPLELWPNGNMAFALC